MNKFPTAPGLMNKNFEHGDQVKFINTGGPELDGRIGKIVGKPMIELCDFYIVDIGEAVSDTRPDSCILITEACIELV